MVIVRISCVAEIRNNGAQVQHRRQLDAELARRMHGNAQPERLADASGFHARTDAAPERRVEQDHVDRAVLHVLGELLEVDDNGVGRDRQADELLEAQHLLHPPDRIFVVVVVQVGDAFAEADRVGKRERAIRIEADAIAGAGFRNRAKCGQFVIRRIDAAFQLVRLESMLGLQRLCMRNELLERSHFALASLAIGMAKEQIARKRNRVAHAATQQITDRNAEFLSDDVQARELDRCVQLRPIVVEAGGRIADREAHRFQPEHIVPAKIGKETRECLRDRFTSAAHFAETDVAVGRLDLDDRANESSPMRAVAVEQRRLERNSDRRRANGADCGGGHDCHRRMGTFQFNRPP